MTRLMSALVLLFVVCAGPGMAFAEDDDVTRVFLFAGQSNMVGADARADQIDDYPPFRGVGQPQRDVKFSYLLERNRTSSNGWTALGPTNYFGPELTFARFVKGRVSFPIAIIKSAVGGTTLFRDWSPAAPEEGLQLYPKTLKLVRDSLKSLEEQGVKYRLEAVIWHQGENDMLNRQEFTKYGERLAPFIDRLRQDLESPNLKFFIGEISEKGIWGMDHRSFLGAIKPQQLKVAQRDDNAYFVPTSHLAFEVMGKGQPHYHFGTQGQLQHGEAYASAYLKAIGKPLQEKRASFGSKLPFDRSKKVRLFVLAGQRNMEGEDAFVADLRSLNGRAELAKPQTNIAFRYSLGGGVRKTDKWEPLGPVGYLGVFGPELSFAPRVRKATDDNVAIVKFTHSGAQGPDWRPEGSKEKHRNLYPRFIGFVKDAIKDLRDRDYRVELAGVFWHTGENDTYYYHRDLAKWMKQLIDSSRKDLEQPKLKWFVSEQHKTSIWRNIEQVNGDLRILADADPNVHLLRTSHLPHGRLHFGAEGVVRLGEEYATAWAIASQLEPKNGGAQKLPEISREAIARLVERLDSDRFLERHQAHQELIKLADFIVRNALAALLERGAETGDYAALLDKGPQRLQRELDDRLLAPLRKATSPEVRLRTRKIQQVVEALQSEAWGEAVRSVSQPLPDKLAKRIHGVTGGFRENTTIFDATFKNGTERTVTAIRVLVKIVDNETQREQSTEIWLGTPRLHLAAGETIVISGDTKMVRQSSDSFYWELKQVLGFEK